MFQELTVDELYELLRVRSEVFVVEQNCVYQDMDGDDQKAIHLWLTVADKVVALARVCPEGTHMEEVSIGRSLRQNETRVMANKSCFKPLMRPSGISMQSASTLRHKNMPVDSMKALDSDNRPNPSYLTVFHISE